MKKFTVFELWNINGQYLGFYALKRKYYIQSKKIWSERYSTDCLSGIYAARGQLNTVGIDDIVEYAGIMATDEELQKQHSHFQYEVHKILIK